MSQAPGWSMPPSGQYPASFFDALHESNGDKAQAILTAEALNSDGTLSPKATESSTVGEWDTNFVLSLKCLDGEFCRGRVGNDGLRFCGRPRDVCTTAAHSKSVVEVDPGWYPEAHGKHTGFYLSGSFPLERDGGPITQKAAGYMLSSGFKLSLGQWKMTAANWRTSNLRIDVPTPSAASGGSDGGFTILEAGLSQSPADVPLTAGDSPPPYGDLFAPFLVEEDDTPLGLSDPAPSPTGDVRFKALRQDFQRQFQRLENRMNNGFGMLGQRMTTVEAALEDGQELFVAVRDECHQLRQQFQASERDKADLLRRVVDLEQLQKAPPGREVCGYSDAALARLEADLQRCVSELTDPQGIVPLLKAQFTSFRERVESGGGIECHGVKFASKKDCLAWVEARNIGDPAIFLDALAVLHAIRLPYMAPNEALKEVELQEKVRYTSQLEVAMKNSFSYPLPPVLIGGKRHLEGGSAYELLLGYLKKFEVWLPDLGPTGVATQIEEGVEKVQGRWQEYRDSTTDDPGVCLLTQGLVMDSIKFCHDLIRFVNDQNRELSKGTAYSASQVWEMQIECITTILGEVSAVREVEADAGKQNPGYYVWGMLRAWEIQQRYRKNKFKDDPMLTGILVRRIVMNGGDGGVMAKLQKMDELFKLVDANHKTVMGEVRKLQAALKTNNSGK